MKKHFRLAMALTAAMGLAALGGLALTACDSSGHTHDWNDWEISTAATCTTDGKETRSCKKCDVTETQTIDKTGHKIGDWTVTKAAKCEVAGERVKICSNCKETMQTETIDPTGHKWDEGTYLEQPDCTTFGLIKYICTADGCGETNQERIQPTGHEWEELRGSVHATCLVAGTIKQKCIWCETEDEYKENPLGHNYEVYEYRAATCEEDGYINRICLRAGCTEKLGEEILPNLGHIYQFTGTYPTFTEEGHGKDVCIRCNKSGEEKTLPTLKANEAIDYTIIFARVNNENMDGKTVSFTILDENGNDVKTVTDFALSSTACKYSTELLPAKYTIRLDKAPENIQLETLSVSYENPVSRVYLQKSLISELPASARYKVGDQLHDYTYTTLDGKTITLSEFMKDKKVLILNFFYVHCTWCDFEFPGLVKAYEKYKDDVALLAIDPASFDTADTVKEYAQGGWSPSRYHPSGFEAPAFNFTIVQDTTDKLSQFFRLNGFPTTIVIDREGVIRQIHGGVMAGYYEGTTNMDPDSSERMFGELFEEYINDFDSWNFPGNETAGASVHSYSAYEVILPGKQEF